MKRQQTRRDEILHYIADYVVEHHNAPSTMEIARAFDLCQTTIYTHMLKLQVEGRLTLIDGRWKLPLAEYIPPSLD